MRILFFLESLHRGGKERRVLELIHFLKSEKDIKILLVLTEAKIHYQSVYDLGINIEIVQRRSLRYDPRLFSKFYKRCRQFKPDIIHTWGKMTTFYAIPAKVFCRVPVISNLISDSEKQFSKYSFDAFFTAADIRFSDVILSNSKSGLIEYNVKSSKAKVIPNGVDLERFQKEFDTKKVRVELGISTEFIVIMVASFSKYKNYDLFIDTAIEFGKIRNDTTFVGVGDGSEWSRIHQRIKDEKVENVILTGMKTEIEPIVAASDIGILCTYSEGISNSIVEYMAMGKPVISTDMVGGSKEIIVEGETGYCIEPNPEKLIYFINLLLNDIKLRLSMGEKGRERVNSHFSIEKMGEEFIALYKQVLSDEHSKKNSHN